MSDDGEDVSDLEKTILMMESSNLCAHLSHCHSFRKVNFYLSWGSCSGCNRPLQSVMFGMGASDGASSSEVVKCIACNAVAHRKCALSGAWSGPVCPVNSVIVDDEEEEDDGDLCKSIDNEEDYDALNVQEFSIPAEECKTEGAQNVPISAPATAQSDGHMRDKATISKDEDISVVVDDWNWTENGPPRHWASNPAMLKGLIPSSQNQNEENDADNDETHNNKKNESEPILTKCEDKSDDNNKENSEPSEDTSALYFSEHPFASVSRALQENILAHFKILGGSTLVEDIESPDNFESVNVQNEEEEKDSLDKKDATTNEPDVKEVLTQIEPTPEPKPAESSTLVKAAWGAYETAKITARTSERLGIASVAGGIAGGVAGLYIAGPAGAVLGCQYGRTAGVLGILVQGSLNVGVIVAGVMSGSKTAQQLRDQMDEKRIVTMGEDGTSQKVMLVRPNVKIDPIWHDLCEEAKRSYHKSRPLVPFLSSTESGIRKQRYHKVNDIVDTEEDEIPTTDKVILMVYRILNDKSSYPGYVYRHLIKEFRDRCDKRKINISPKEEDEGVIIASRERREDAHAVIKHVTATLLEVRPGFGASPTITELTATAVEELVFGEVYDLVLEEIAFEASERDKALKEKIHEIILAGEINVSSEALNALRSVPEAHSAVEKLRRCVLFLELVSEHFSTLSSKLMAADSLLKMACQHILAANVPWINAEVAFLEEFARDEQLLRGKEGYALVTLQASLHFLNESTDIQGQIFGDDGDEDIIQVQS